ncbi:MAG: caspase family protein [Ferruginibacter sp.]
MKTKIITCNLFVLLLLIFTTATAQSSYLAKNKNYLSSAGLTLPNKLALIIGIDTYTPPAGYIPPNTVGRKDFPSLEGCLNDALSIKSVITSKFQFEQKNIQTLLDTNATRDNILNEMNNLLNKCKKGDIAFIYYAGHGSQEYNSLSQELDKYDETIVPADTWKAGVDDIRDKELAKIFNSFIDKGVKLTVIFDCCHSGSMSRGGPNFGTGKMRFMPVRDAKVYDSKDASNPTPPETRKDGSFLIIGAAQDNEFADEQADDNKPQQHHGAFTLAFLEALNQQSVNASVQNLFSSIRSILKSNGKAQEPVLSALPDRKKETLFGIAKGELADKTLIAVSGFLKNKVELQGGFAINLYKENELTKIKDGDTIKLRVDTVLGVNKSIATVIKGKINNIQPGELFEVTNWVSSAAPLLKIFIPNSNFSYAQVANLAKLNNDLKQSKNVIWVNNLEKIDPFTKIYFNNDICYISEDTGRGKEVKNYDLESLLTLSKKGKTVYFELPPSKEIANAIKDKLKPNHAIKIVKKPSEANYVLFGTTDRSGILSYGLRRTETSAKDTLESMPLITTAFELKGNQQEDLDFVSDSIFYYAMRLSKIRGWLHVAGPKGENSEFPYHIQFVNAISKKIIDSGYKIGDSVAINLVLNDNYLKARLDQKYVYIFGIDRDGNMGLVYPSNGDCSVANRFPVMGDNVNLANTIDLNTSWTVPAPAGIDNYFLLATKDPINNCEVVFQQEGVNNGGERGVRGLDTNPLAELLDMGNESSSRGFPIKSKLSTDWYLVKVAMKCRH